MTNLIESALRPLGRPLVLEPPDNVRLTIVFRQVVKCLPAVRPLASDLELLFVESGAGMRRCWPALRRRWGLGAAAKGGLKVLSGRRKLYVVLEKTAQRLLAYGWINVGINRRYPVRERDVVVGPIATYEEARGKGLATAGLQFSVAQMAGRGFQVFYLDTREDNVGCIKAALACGFTPVAAHWMPPDYAEPVV